MFDFFKIKPVSAEDYAVNLPQEKPKQSNTTLYSFGISTENRLEISIGQGYETLRLNTTALGELIEQLDMFHQQMLSRENEEQKTNSTDS